ncbi:hypothetical protein JXB37_00750, partial [candidate division WOR-3 bacterium]|nr:hypothetical protein [candidate division WOR-3 bacterium]
MKHLILALLLALAAPLSAQVRFQQAFGGAELDYGFAVVQTDDGGYLVAGETESFGAGFRDVWLVRTDSLGDTLWTRTYGTANYDAAFALAPASNGGHWVAGAAARSNGYTDVWLARIDAAGDTCFTRTWGGQYNDYGFSVVATGDGGCAITGETQSFGAGYSDGWLLKVNASGDTSWTRTFGTANYDFLYSVRAVPAGGYILAGSTRLPSGQEDAWLLRTDGDGIESWSRVFATTGFEELRTAVPTSDGGFAAAGTAPGVSRNHFWLVKTDAAGDTLWTRVYERWPTTGEVGYSMAQTMDGGYVMTGSSQAEDVWVVRTDAAGDTLWTRLIGGSQPDAGRSVIQAADGGFALTGYTRSYGGGWLDVWLVKTDA